MKTIVKSKMFKVISVSLMFLSVFFLALVLANAIQYLYAEHWTTKYLDNLLTDVVLLGISLIFCIASINKYHDLKWKAYEEELEHNKARKRA